MRFNRQVPAWALVAVVVIFGGLKTLDLLRIRSLNRLVETQAELIQALSKHSSGRDAIAHNAGQIASVFSSARIAPVRDGEAIRGLRLTNLTPQGFIASLGAREGDVIRSINTIRVRDALSYAKALELLTSTQALTIEVVDANGETRVLKSVQ